MSWGHAVSSDLVHWKQLPAALHEEDGIAIFSGSTVEDRDNTSGLCAAAGEKSPGCLVAIYTGSSLEKQTQNIAFSRDGGATWTKYPGNPVIDLGLKDFRDPKVFWHAATKSWVMVVALPRLHKVRFYRSKDLRQWVLAGEFGPAGAVSGVWECPDLFELPVRDGNGNFVSTRWLLSVNVNTGAPAGGSGDQYFIGKFDGSHFTEDHPGSGAHWADWGADFYASTSFSNLPQDPDRLRDPIWIAWMDNWQYARMLPALPGRGQMTLARSLFLRRAARPSCSHSRPGATPTGAAPDSAHPRLQTLFGHVRRAGHFNPSPMPMRDLPKPRPRAASTLCASTSIPEKPRRPASASAAAPPIPTIPRKKKPSSASTRKRDRSFSIAPTPAKQTGLPNSPRAWSPRSSIRRKPQSTSKSSSTKTPSRSSPTTAKPSSPASSTPLKPARASSFFATQIPPGFDPAQIRDIQLFPSSSPPQSKSQANPRPKNKSPQPSQEGRGLLLIPIP